MHGKTMTFIKEKWVNLVLLCLLALGAWLRASLYGDLNLSVGNPDTPSYIEASTASIFSAEIFTGRRLFTTNVLYKLVNDPHKCPLEVISYPAEGNEADRAIQPCFNVIALLQNWLSIFAWCLLAWTTARWIESSLYKFLAVGLILIFGFTPQIAEWDSVLSAESFSISLFAVIVALLQEIILLLTSEDQKRSFFKIGFLIPLWFIILILWVFIRDVHLYVLLITVALTLPLLFLPKFRKLPYVPLVLIVSVAIFMLGNTTSKNSPRWPPSITHAFADFVDPYPARVEFFQKLGMPEDRSSKEYEAWFQDKALSSYSRFLILHPRFLVSTIFEAGFFKSDFIQPYFRAPEVMYRETLLIIGEFLHPETYAIYLIDFLLLVSICYTALKSREQKMYGLAWLAMWMFLYLVTSLILSYFGDTAGTRRHIFPSVEGLRLFGWIFLLINMDVAARNILLKDTVNEYSIS